MKKTMYLALAVLFLWGVWFSTPLTALAAEGEPTITAVELTATKSLLENYNGCEDTGDLDNPFWYYNIAETEPTMLLTYSDGSTKEVAWEFFYEYFDSYYFEANQSKSNELGVGSHTADVSLNTYDERTIETTINFTIEENPVESISVVANNSLTENISGDFINVTDEEGNIVGSEFAYDVSLADIKVTVNYKNGTSSTYDYSYNSENNLLEKTGEDLIFDYNNLVVGTNTITVEYMGVGTTLELEIVENPYQSISLEATEDLIYEHNCKDYGDYCVYSLSDTNPVVTVTYTNGTVKDYSYSQCEEVFGSFPVFKCEQTPSYQFVKGENTQLVTFLGCECIYTFNIVETPVESIIVDAPPLEQYKSGHFTGNGYWYELDETETKVTINYKDENKPAETYTLDYIKNEYPNDFYLILKQSGENKIGVGTHKGSVYFKGCECAFDYTVEPNAIKSISVVATKKLIKNESGSFNGEYFEYDVFSTSPEVTVTFSDGNVQKYDFYEVSQLDYTFSIDSRQSSENILTVGKHTAYAFLNGVVCEFTFEIIENPIKSFSLKATKDLVEKQNGYWGEYRGTEVFCYDVDETLPEVTVNYTDGISKTYSYSEYFRVFDYDMDLDQTDQFNSPFKVGENTIKAYIGNFECDYTFNIVKPEVAITGITVVPESTLLEGHNCDFVYDEEGNEGCVYHPDAVNYTLIVKYEDGTQETYENVFYNQTVDGGFFSVYFGDWTYENRYVVGKNKAYAEYKGARTTFDIEVVKNDIKDIEISGENEFILTTIATDGTKTKYTARDLHIVGMSDENICDGSLYTDKGALMISLSLNLNDDETQFKDIIAYFTLPDGTVLESNKLSSNRWLDMIFYTMNLDEASKWLYDGYSEKYFGNSFHELEGTVIKGSAVDKALTICTALDYIGNYENTGEDDKGGFAILTLAEAERLANNYFADGKLDIESSPLYNAPAKEIKVYFLLGCDAAGINRELKYENGKFILTSMCVNNDTNETIPVKMILSDTGYVDSIYVSEHSYTSEIIKQPTATEKGVKEYTCSCGDTYLTDIDKLVASVPVNKDNSFSATVTVTETENIVSKIEITKEEQELINLGLDLKIILEVKEIENKIDTEEKKAIVEILGEQKLGAFIDIQLVKQIGDYEKNIETTNGKIYVSLELPKSLINNDLKVERIYKVARYHDGDENKVTILDATYDAATNMLVFGTDRFSTYAIIYNDVEVSNDGASGGVSEGVPVIPDSDNVTNDNSKDEVPKAGVISTSVLWFGAMAVSGLGALALSKKKKED